MLLQDTPESTEARIEFLALLDVAYDQGDMDYAGLLNLLTKQIPITAEQSAVDVLKFFRKNRLRFANDEAKNLLRHARMVAHQRRGEDDLVEYLDFGSFSTIELDQQCQYASRYLHGNIEGYPNLNEKGDIRTKGNVHSWPNIKIHVDDIPKFLERYFEL